MKLSPNNIEKTFQVTKILRDSVILLRGFGFSN